MNVTTSTPPGPENEPKENVHVTAMKKHHDDIHNHLRQAHASAGSKAARMHITQAGMAASALHKSANQALAAEGQPQGGAVSEYNTDANGNYGGQG